MENRKRSSSYKKSSDNKGGKGSFKKDDKPFKKEGGFKREFKKRDSDEPGQRSNDTDKGPRRSFDKTTRFKKEGEEDKKPFRREGGYKKDLGAKSDRPYRKFDSDRPKRTYNDKPSGFRKDGDDDKKPFRREGGYKKDFGAKSDRPYKKFDGDRPKRTYDDRPSGFKKEGDDDKKPLTKEGGYKKDFGSKGDRPYKKFDSDRPKRTYNKPSGFKKEDDSERKPFKREGGFKKEFKKFDSDKPRFEKEETKRGTKDLKTGQPLKFHKFTKFDKEEKEATIPEKAMTLNKYIAHSGECSRREAAEMVKQGKVKVNGELVLEPGYRVLPEDKVTFAGKKLTPTKHFIYVLLNKPKGYITTTDDPQERATVMDLVEGVEGGRLYPVGRLDRNTSGLLLLTNDGDLAQKLSHPSYETKKVYQVTLDRPLEREDLEKIQKGVELEDGKAKVDAIEYLDAKNEIGLEIHSGKNRIVRRIFESLKYDVEKLDRVMYAGLTKKNLPRGKWRLLTEKELVFLKHFKSK